MAVTAAEVIEKCRTIAGYSEESGFTTRPFLAPSMRLVHQDLGAWMRRTGMEVQVDAAGNLRGVYQASCRGARRLFIGSHLDTVARAGAFDGVLGVVLGLAVIDSLQGERLPFAIEVIGFSDEEGVRFGVPFIGSRAFAGTADEALLAARDAEGVSVAAAIRSYGLEPDAIAAAAAGVGAIGYFEVHIEQGPVLDRLGRPVGVVDAIVGQSRALVTFRGSAGHAGTTPMEVRRDALAGAAEWIASVERCARDTAGLVATVGRIEAHPGGSNVIAGSCTASLDVRHADDRVRTNAVASLARRADEIAARRQLTVEWSAKLDQPAVSMDRDLTLALERAVGEAGAPLHRLASGAGHDAMVVAARMPTAMLFLRSPGGISHSPDEAVLESDVAVALQVVRHFLRRLAATLG